MNLNYGGFSATRPSLTILDGLLQESTPIKPPCLNPLSP